jgi:hypothetical protein
MPLLDRSRAGYSGQCFSAALPGRKDDVAQIEFPSQFETGFHGRAEFPDRYRLSPVDWVYAFKCGTVSGGIGADDRGLLLTFRGKIYQQRTNQSRCRENRDQSRESSA